MTQSDSQTTDSPYDDQTTLRFIEEYKLCCKDWSTRDAYVQQKFFNVAVVLFGFIVAAAGTLRIQDSTPIELAIYTICFFLLAIYMLIALISTTKDVYYRDGSELLLRRILARLPGGDEIDDVLEDLKSSRRITSIKRGRATRENPRKVKATSVDSLGVTPAMERFLATRGTYRWIVRFYAFVFLCCLAGCAYCIWKLVWL